MEYKSNLFLKILGVIISHFCIAVPFMVSFAMQNQFFLLSSPIFIFGGIDYFYLTFRIIIIDRNVIRIKLFGIIIKEENIETIAYNNFLYGIRSYTHIFGSVKSIIFNKKYFSCITKIDQNFYELKLTVGMGMEEKLY
jgi:hypothetical protein